MMLWFIGYSIFAVWVLFEQRNVVDDNWAGVVLVLLAGLILWPIMVTVVAWDVAMEKVGRK